MKGKGKKGSRIWLGLSSVLCFILAILIGLTGVAFDYYGLVNNYLGVDQSATNSSQNDGPIYYATSYGDGKPSDETLRQLIADEDDFNRRVAEEGTVLIKNENFALPLAENERNVTLFGWATTHPVYRGGSAGPTIDQNRLIDLKKGLELGGFRVNEAIYDALNSQDLSHSNVKIGEVDANFYTDELKKSFESDYNDIAIVMFARTGGEESDLAVSDVEGFPLLSLHPQEADLLRMIKESGKFGKTIVLINSGWPMELGWLEDPQYGVDACLWVGMPGLTGFTGLPNILTGAENPSGRLIDTYAASSLSAPSMRNFGDFSFVGNEGKNYIIEAEGIYWGYKYYETRYQDQVLGINNATGDYGVYAGEGTWDYATEMCYPFGYGLSYTTFEQKLLDVQWNRADKTVTATVLVTNTGDRAGKDVIEFYVQLPYEKGYAERPAIQLVDFAKTDIIMPGESVEITIETDEYLFAVWDSNANDGIGGYVYDAGNYIFSIGNDVHDALNNVLSARGDAVIDLFSYDGSIVAGNPENTRTFNVAEADSQSYAKSQYTGEDVINRFGFADYNSYFDDAVVYLTRDDWSTYPKTYSNMECNDTMLTMMDVGSYEIPSVSASGKSFSDYTQGVVYDDPINFIEMKDVEWEDEETWDRFINQLTFDDLCAILGDSTGTPVVKTINKPKSKNNDGPDGFMDIYRYGGNNPVTTHASEQLLSSTWNKQLMAERGKYMGEDALHCNGNQQWAPGSNSHRTPYSGRNHEYFSEDGIFGYICNGIIVKEMQAMGLMAAPKHFAANDQETNRKTVCTFMTEQALRQGPMKVFEGAFTVGGALGTMTSYNLIGCVPDHCCKALLTDVLRGEWGFKGVTITDALGSPNNESHAYRAIEAGTDMWCYAGKGTAKYYRQLLEEENVATLEALRETNKRHYYAFLRTSIVNGLTVDAVSEESIAWWQPTLIAIDAVVGVAAVTLVVLYIWKQKKGGV